MNEERKIIDAKIKDLVLYQIAFARNVSLVMCELVQELLEAEGFVVESALDGDKGIAKAKALKPDLILLDLMMPGVSGRKVFERLRKDPKTQKMRIVFFTVVRPPEGDKDAPKNLKIFDYITKPFDNDDFIKRVKKALRN